jgi:hypothetical protein
MSAASRARSVGAGAFSLGGALFAARWVLLSALVFVVLAFLIYGQSGPDDAYITYWPARTLAEHGRIWNYNGVRVEQSSSLSLVVVLAILYRLTPFSMPVVAFLTSLGFGVATLWLAERVARRLDLQPSVAVVPVIATVACFGSWATSGMEMSLVAASGLLMVLQLERLPDAEAGRRPTLTAALAVLFFAASRPEAPVIVVGVALAGALSLLSARATGEAGLGGRLRALGRLAVATASPLLVLVAFRRLYFRAWVPNSAALKVGGFNLREGFAYLWDGLALNGFVLGALALVGLVCLAWQLGARRPGNFLLALLGAEMLGHLGFVVGSGGDWMSGARFLAPAIPTLVLLGLAGASLLANGASLRGLALVLVFANLFSIVQFVRASGNDGRPGFLLPAAVHQFRKQFGAQKFGLIELANKVHERDAGTLSNFLPVVARAVAASPERPIWVITGQAGMMGYYLMSKQFGKAKLLDFWSITTRELYDCLPAGSAPSSKAGSAIGLGQYLDAMPSLEARCGLPRPDFFYNECLPDGDRQLLVSHGYRILYNQFGDVRDLDQSPLLPAQIGGCGYFAVREDLAQKLGLGAEKSVAWASNPRL